MCIIKNKHIFLNLVLFVIIIILECWFAIKQRYSIPNYNTIKQRSVFFISSPYLVKLVLKKLQDPLFKLVFINFLNLYSLLMFSNNTSNNNSSQIMNTYIIFKKKRKVRKNRKRRKFFSKYVSLYFLFSFKTIN